MSNTTQTAAVLSGPGRVTGSLLAGPWRRQPAAGGSWRIVDSSGRVVMRLPRGGLTKTEARQRDAVALAVALLPELIDIADEFLADQETMNEPYRNAAICERARVILDQLQGQPAPAVSPVATLPPGTTTLCASCAQADVSCPIYPHETVSCVEYRPAAKP